MPNAHRASHRTATANTHGSKWLTPVRRLALYLRDAYTCAYCARQLHTAPRRDITLDHVRPRGRNGRPDHRSTNLVVACRSCNSARQDKPLHRWASATARAHVRRQTRRSMARHLATARAMLAARQLDTVAA